MSNTYLLITFLMIVEVGKCTYFFPQLVSESWFTFEENWRHIDLFIFFLSPEFICLFIEVSEDHTIIYYKPDK